MDGWYSVQPHHSNFWPSNSLDLNLLDFYVCSIVEKWVNEHPNNIKDSLKAPIVWVMSDMNKEQLVRAFNRFRSHIEAVIDASGGFME